MENNILHLWFTALGFTSGAVLGSFIKVLADRSLDNKSFLGRSVCMNCKKTLSWYDLFPILSFFFLRGKCRFCHKKIGWEYLLVEITVGLLVGFLFWQSAARMPVLADPFALAIFLLDLLLKVFFIGILAAVTITDYKDTLIPDRIILPSILIALGWMMVIALARIIYLYVGLSHSTIGQFLLPPYSDFFQRHVVMALESLYSGVLTGLGLGGFFLALIIITKGKGMGGGDVKLGAFMGLILGFNRTLLATTLAFIAGAAFSILLIFIGKKHFKQSIAFGPFLVLGSLIALFFTDQILTWYLSFSR